MRSPALLDVPEAPVAVFAFLLNFAWENLQASLYQGMATAPHGSAVKLCALASLGDMTIALFAFWAVAAATRDRRWILSPESGQVAGFTALGLLVSVVVEKLATGPMNRWAYSAAMPILPGLGLGLAPVLQWLVLPPLVLWLSRRHLGGRP